MTSLAIFMLLNLLGAMSPGPDFAIVVRYGLTGSRRASLLASVGIAAAVVIHAIYCLMGIALFLKNTPLLFHSIQIMGAIYLAYLGFYMFLDGFHGKNSDTISDAKLDGQAFRSGFITNLTNPKAMVFLLSLFTQFVTPDMTWGMKLAFGVSMPLVALFWFSSLSVLITHPRLYHHLQKYQHIFTGVMGILLLVVASYVLFSSVCFLYPLSWKTHIQG